MEDKYFLKIDYAEFFFKVAVRFSDENSIIK